MSWDFIEDAIDSLEKDGCHYVLLVGKEGYHSTRITSNIHNKADLDHMVNSLILHRNKILKEEA